MWLPKTIFYSYGTKNYFCSTEEALSGNYTVTIYRSFDNIQIYRGHATNMENIENTVARIKEIHS